MIYIESPSDQPHIYRIYQKAHSSNRTELADLMHRFAKQINRINQADLLTIAICLNNEK
ncbi:MAG: hypothetical protein ACI84K_001566 [Pseudohongiellaceae bacterium]